MIAPQGAHDMIGIVTALEGEPLPSGDIASRLGGFADIAAMEADAERAADAEIIEMLLGTKNELHNNYQDFQAFLDAGGRIGLQHDPLLYGAYLLNPFLVRVEMVPMLVVNQGEVAVIKATSACRRWTRRAPSSSSARSCGPGTAASGRSRCAPASTPINPRVYAAEIVPTSILTLNWADAVSQAHNLDAQLDADRGQEPRGLRLHASICRCRSTCRTRGRRR